MKLIVDEVAYDITESLQGAALGDLMNLKLKTRRPEDKFLGVTVRFITDTFTEMGKQAQSEEFNGLDLLGDEDVLSAMVGLIYLARRKSGEKIEVADAEATSFSSFYLDADDDDVDEVEVPKDEDSDAPQ